MQLRIMSSAETSNAIRICTSFCSQSASSQPYELDGAYLIGLGDKEIFEGLYVCLNRVLGRCLRELDEHMTKNHHDRERVRTCSCSWLHAAAGFAVSTFLHVTPLQPQLSARLQLV